jgi:hypothetical protein
MSFPPQGKHLPSVRRNNDQTEVIEQDGSQTPISADYRVTNQPQMTIFPKAFIQESFFSI